MDEDKYFGHNLKNKHRSYLIQKTYPNNKLSQKESMCLFYVMRGKNNREISAILNLSCRTIEGKIASIKEKLNCSSRHQLIEKSVNQGYLDIIINQLFKKGGHSINLI